MIRPFLAALALAGCAFPPPETPDTGRLVITRDAGGYAHKYLAATRLADQRGVAVWIVGECVSACTLYLSTRRACVAPDARLGFHAGRAPSDWRKTDEQLAHRDWVVYARHLPIELRDPYMKGMRKRHMTYLSGETVHDLTGIPFCGE